MKLFLLTVIVVAFCVVALSFNIIFRKDGQFPDGEIEHNKALRKQGIRCAKMEERRLWGKRRHPGVESSCDEADCGSCGISCLKQQLKEAGKDASQLE